MIFTVGNLITLGIVLLLFILFRLLDKNNRTPERITEHVSKCKKEIDAYIKEKNAAIKNFGITLDVEKKSAESLMARIQNLTREELNQKVQALAVIDERIRDYDASLEELVQMTGIVQENLSRIRDESSFVESVGKRIGEFKDKAESVQDEIDHLEKKIASINRNFELENTKALEKAVDATISGAKSTLLDFEASAQVMERKLEEHREAVERLEQGIEKMCTEAISKAVSKADKIEDAAMAKLREQAQERLQQIKTHFEEKIKTAQEKAKIKITEIQDQIKNSREEWRLESASIDASRKSFSTELKKDIQEITVYAQQNKDQLNKEIQEINTAISKQQESWEALARNTGLEIITVVEEKLEGYRAAQDEQFRQLAGISNDSAQLEAELRHSMEAAITRVNNDFANYDKEIHGLWEKSSDEFNGHLQNVREELTGVDQKITQLKEKSFQNVSEKLKGFEDEFISNLSTRSSEMEQQFITWEETLDARLDSLSADTDAKQKKAELKFLEEMKKSISLQGEKIVSDLDRLKTETSAFEEGIREEMRGVDESRKSFMEQLEHDFEEVKTSAENELNVKISQFSISVTDSLRQSQREYDGQIRNLASDIKQQIADLENSSENFRLNIEEWQNQFSNRMREFDASLEENRRRSRELTAENDERLSAVRTSIDEIRKELTVQTKLFEHTDALKTELDRHVKDMSGDINRISQLKNEITRFENQFVQIKRLEEDVNAKMTRFLSEKHRIEVMENDFNRLLKTSQSVEERLSQVSNSDDILQTMQIQLRRLEDVIKDTEEKYQRIEKKSKAIQETNNGIDRNFKALQEEEQSIERLKEIVNGIKNEMETVQHSVETLSAENEKAREAAEKLSSLDESITWLDQRIAEMNVARESAARLATELKKNYKEAQEQVKLSRSLMDRKTVKGKGPGDKDKDEGSAPINQKANVIKLKREGWTVEEIARSLNISRGEVELIIELGPRDV